MSKRDFLKRAGQIYSLGIQRGYSEDDISQRLEKVFSCLHQKGNT